MRIRRVHTSIPKKMAALDGVLPTLKSYLGSAARVVLLAKAYEARYTAVVRRGHVRQPTAGLPLEEHTNAGRPLQQPLIQHLAMLRQLLKVLRLGYDGLTSRCLQTIRPNLFFFFWGVKQYVTLGRIRSISAYSSKNEGLLHDVLVVLLALRGELLEEVHTERQTPGIGSYTPALGVL